MGYVTNTGHFFNDPNRPRANSSMGMLNYPAPTTSTVPPRTAAPTAPTPQQPTAPRMGDFASMFWMRAPGQSSQSDPISPPADTPRPPMRGPAANSQPAPRGNPSPVPSSAARVMPTPQPSNPAAPGLPTRAAGTPLPQGIDRSGTNQAIAGLGRGVDIRTGARADLDGPDAENEWERMAREQYAEGFDPGQLFQGKALSDTVYTPEQINQLAQAGAAPTIRAMQDEKRLLEEAARIGGGKISPATLAALKAKAAAEGAGALSAATRDASLMATRANAEQAARAAENLRSNFSTDITGRNTLGRMKLDSAGDLLDAGGRRRSTDQERDIERYRGTISQRGQDIDADVAEKRINTDRSSAAVRARLDNDAATMAERFGISDRAEQRRTNDMGFDLDRARLGTEQWRTSGDWQQQNADRQSRMAALDAQLQDASLDRGTRSQLERERMTLQRELETAQRQEAARQFDAGHGLDRDRFEEARRQFAQQFGLSEREFTEGTRRFDAGQELEREQGRLNRSAARGPLTSGSVTYATPPGGVSIRGNFGGGDTPPTVSTPDPRMRAVLEALKQLSSRAAA